MFLLFHRCYSLVGDPFDVFVFLSPWFEPLTTIVPFDLLVHPFPLVQTFTTTIIPNFLVHPISMVQTSHNCCSS
jgi:hypothetical protein